MLGYFIKRLFFFVPTLLIISMVAFGLSKLTPGDAIECGTGLTDIGEDHSVYSKAYKDLYLQTAKQKGLDRPPFYFNINPLSHPDTLYRIVIKEEREYCSDLIQQWGNWPAIQQWKNQQEQLARTIDANFDLFSKDAVIEVKRILSDLALLRDKAIITKKYKDLETWLATDAAIQSDIQKTVSSFNAIFINNNGWKKFIPTFHWFGFDNQYHNWITGIVKGDFGISCRNGLEAAKKIKKSIFWTLMLNIPSILLAFLIAIPLGIYAGMNEGGKLDKYANSILFLLYSMPSFWLGTILVMFFTTPEYSRFLDWFPSVGIGNLPASAPLGARFMESAGHMILPIICNTYVALAFIFSQMRNGVLNVVPQDYIQTAKAKGLSEKAIVRKHVLKNSIFPIITLVGNILPSAISGSIVIELIFNIPGLGRETLNAIFAHDWPIVYLILFIGAGLTMFGILISDLLYAWLDPRISFASGKKNNSI